MLLWDPLPFWELQKSSQKNIEEREHGVEGISLHSSLRGLGIFQLGLQHQNDRGSFGPYGHK